MAKFALLSVSNKTGLVEFATALVRDHGYTLLSTGGSAKQLAASGLPVTEVGAHTGFPEMMDGRVKTLHPKIHGALLARRDKPEHLAQAAAAGIPLIDLVVMNLYPFEETIAKPHVTFEEAIENIDIGGPSMLRSAAKNHESVTVVCDPADYAAVLVALKVPAELSALRRRLALKVFQRTGSYDTAIARYLETQAAEPDLAALAGFPDTLTLTYKKAQSLRYGENPHQAAALYLFLVIVGDSKGLSYYSDVSLMRRLGMSAPMLDAARRELVGTGLVCFEKPLYQVLSLDVRPQKQKLGSGGLMSLGEIMVHIQEAHQ